MTAELTVRFAVVWKWVQVFCQYEDLCLVWTSRGLQEGFIRAADGLKRLRLKASGGSTCLS